MVGDEKRVRVIRIRRSPKICFSVGVGLESEENAKRVTTRV